MKKEIATKWTEALRSGKYKQGANRLRKTDESFCCLGVLCDISKQGEWKNGDEVVTSGIKAFVYESPGDIQSAAPTSKVMEWSGLKTASGSIENCLSISPLWTMNDNEGKSFSEIADHIEKHWEQL